VVALKRRKASLAHRQINRSRNAVVALKPAFARRVKKAPTTKQERRGGIETG